jgi:hypothetical protein
MVPARWAGWPGRAGRTGRAALRGMAACVTAGCAVAACSSSGQPAGGGSSAPATAALPPAARAAQAARGLVGGGAPVRVFIVGGAGGDFVAAAPAVPGGASSRPRITVGPIPAAGSNQPVNLPLDAYSGVSISQQTVLTEASGLLTQQCMAGRGFVYSAPASGSQEQALVQATEYGFGVTSASAASSYGYGQAAGAGGAQAGPAFLGGFASFGDLASQPRAWTVALLGFAPGAHIGARTPAGCLSVASQELDGAGGSGLPDPVPAIALQASTWTQSDPRVVAVVAAWSRCMAQRGYKYRSPEAAANAGWPKKPTTAETATAAADVACKEQVNLPNTWLAVEAAYQAALIGQDVATLAHLQASFAGMLRRAEALLSGSARPAVRQLQPGGVLRQGGRGGIVRFGVVPSGAGG